MYPGERLRQERRRCHLSQAALAEALGVSVQSISRWERDEAVPQAHLRLQLSQFFHISPAELWGDEEHQRQEQEQVIPQLIWNVPYRRNPFFTGREEALERLHTTLTARHTVALSQVPAISGLGGIGKTQTALEYVYRFRDGYHAVFWVHAETREQLIADYFTLAELLGFSENERQKLHQVIAAVKGWLATQQRWLLVFDNAEDLTIIREFLPPDQQGHVLLTTRIQSTGQVAHNIALERLSCEEGALFLLRRAKLIDLSSPQESVPASLWAAAEEIVRLMDGLPLALDQAGAYIEEAGCSVPDYLARFSSHQRALLARRGGVAEEHPASVFTTFAFSFERVECENPGAANILRLCAFLAPDAIPEEFLTEHTREIISEELVFPSDAFELDEALITLRHYSLLQRHPETQTLNIHRLVQVVMREQMPLDMQQQWACRAIQLVSQAFPESGFEEWPQCQRYLSHALVCAALITQWEVSSLAAVHLLFQAGTYLHHHLAHYKQAEPLLLRAVDLSKRLLGPEHPMVVATMDRLAEVYFYQGKLALAEALSQEILLARRQRLGLSHPEVATSLSDIAGIRHRQGKYTQAEQLYQQALTMQEQIPGADHLHTAGTLHNFGMLYLTLGKYRQAATLLQRALGMLEQEYGLENPTTFMTFNHVGYVYLKQGQYMLAERTLQQALAIGRRVLPKEHPRVAKTLDYMAELYLEIGKEAEAEHCLHQAIAIQEKLIGSDHPYMAYLLKLQADLCYAQHQYSQGEQCCQRARTIFERHFESPSLDIACCLATLAKLSREQGNRRQAELLFEQAYQMLIQTVGIEHPETASTLHEWAVLAIRQGKLDKALSLFQQALSIREQVFGPEHPKTNDTRQHLQAVLDAMGKVEEVGDCEVVMPDKGKGETF